MRHGAISNQLFSCLLRFDFFNDRISAAAQGKKKKITAYVVIVELVCVRQLSQSEPRI